MSKGMWITIGIVVILALAGWWYVSQPAAPTPAGSESSPAAQGTTGTQAGNTGGGALSSGSSDALLNADLQSIDGQMQSAQSAGASASSFNDTPVQQTE